MSVHWLVLVKGMYQDRDEGETSTQNGFCEVSPVISLGESGGRQLHPAWSPTLQPRRASELTVGFRDRSSYILMGGVKTLGESRARRPGAVL